MEWRKCPNYSRYEVSEEGDIRRIVPPKRKMAYPITGHEQRGYIWVGLIRDDGKRVNTAVHVLVCSAFNGPRPSKRHEVAHWDGDGGNNRPRNLRWATPKENAVDRKRHGNDLLGEAHPIAKLREADIPLIFALAENGMKQRDIARQFSVHQKQISSVLNHKTWKHISVPSGLTYRAPKGTPLFAIAGGKA